MRNAFARHWPEYVIEAWALGTFMISACLFTTLLEHPSLPVYPHIPNATVRRAGIGLAMGLTAILLIYSPWGKRSGAHMNPSVTLAFWTLGRVPSVDALFYILFQFIGGYAGIMISAFLIGPRIADPAVAYVATVPGGGGAVQAWWAEFMISFLLMGVVLLFSNDSRLSFWTGIAAGGLVAAYILLEAPVSGMSMNPARTFGSALAAHVFDDLWIYFTAPPLGMAAAAEIYKRVEGYGRCAKLIHDESVRCLFCEERPS